MVVGLEVPQSASGTAPGSGMSCCVPAGRPAQPSGCVSAGCGGTLGREARLASSETAGLDSAPVPRGKGSVGSGAAKGYGLASCAAFLWASLVVIGKALGTAEVDPVTAVAVRALLAFAILGGVLVLRRRLRMVNRWRDLVMFVFYGLAVAVNYACYFYALKYCTGATAVLLMYTYPAMVTILGALFLREAITRQKTFALSLTLLGCFLVVKAYDLSLLQATLTGVVHGLMAALAMAVYAVLGRVLSKRYGSWSTVAHGFLFGSAFLWLFRGPARILSAVHTWDLATWSLIAGAALFPTLLAYGLFVRALDYVDAGSASIVCTLEPVLGVFLAWLFFGEGVAYFQALGGLLVLAGVASLQGSPVMRRPRRRG